MTLAAEHVESTAGTLNDKITNTGISTLTISGTINAADIDFINNHLTALSSLDLSGAAIEAYSGNTLSNGRNHSPANTLPEYSLAGSKIMTILLPKQLKALGEGCLAASSITGLEIPEGVETMGIAICDGCTSLTHVTIPSTACTVPPLSFKGCISLSTVTLPNTLHTIGHEAFNACSSLADIDFPVSLTSIGADAFNGTALTRLDLTDCHDLKEIGDWCFGHCPRLTSAALPESLCAAGKGIFFDCKSLTTVTMPESLTTLTPHMFKGASLADTESVIRDNVNTIGDYALYGNDKVTTTSLPASVTTLGDKAMAGMTSLTLLDVTRLNGLPATGEDVFAGTAGKNVTLRTPAHLAQIFKTTPQWQEFDITVDTSTGETSPSIDQPYEKIKIRHEGNILYVTSCRSICTLTLSDLQGRTIAVAHGNGDNSVIVATDNIPAGIVIATILFNDTTTTNTKIIL